MSDPFVPLPSADPARKLNEPFTVKVIPGGAAEPQSFRPLAQSCAAALPEPAAGAHRTEPEITLGRDGDRITHIRVRCACGALVELRCEY